jgi:hypothetical protein
VSGSSRWMVLAENLARAVCSTCVHHSVAGGKGKHDTRRVRSRSAMCLASSVMRGARELLKRAGYSTVALRMRAATGFNSLA